MDLTTNIYVTYHDGNSMEFIQLNKGAIIDFKDSEKSILRKAMRMHLRNAWTGLPNCMLTTAIFANFQTL